MQETVMMRIANNHYSKVLIKKTLKSIMYNTQKSLFSKLEKAKGDEIYKIRMFRKVITAWKTEVYYKRIEKERLQEIRAKMNYKKKLVIMRRWKEFVLSNQVTRAQNYTAIYVNKKNLLTKGLQSIKLYRDASKFEKMRYNNAIKFEQAKLLTIVFKTLQWYKNKKKALHEMQIKTDNVYKILTKRRGFKIFVYKLRENKERRLLNHLALNFSKEKMGRKYFDAIKNHAELQIGLRNQEFCIANYHKERTFMKIFNGLRDYTKERKEYRMNALIFKHRGYQRKLLYLWRVVSILDSKKYISGILLTILGIGNLKKLN